MYNITGGWCSWLSQLSNTHVCTVGPQFKSGSAHFLAHHPSSQAPGRQIFSPQVNPVTITLMLGVPVLVFVRKYFVLVLIELLAGVVVIV